VFSNVLKTLIGTGAVMRAVVLVAGTVLLAVARLSFAAAPEGQIARGGYLVNHAAMCVQCHTPRDANGELDHAQLFKGAPISVRSPFPKQTWAFVAPAIAGLPGWTDHSAVTLLNSGRRPNGYAPRRPMPPFRLTREDAEAVVAYLRSLR
jgi:mono/diheme cytochrome c family protein